MWHASFALLAALLVSATVRAQDALTDERPRRIDVFVDRTIAEEIARLLELTPEQRAAAMRAIAKYQTAVHELDKRADEKLKPLADQLRTLPSEYAKETPERLQIAEEFHAVQVPVLLEADNLLQHMLAAILPILTEEQAAAMPRVMALIRRHNLIRRNLDGEYSPFTNIDMLVVLSAAQEEGCELSGLSGRLMPSTDPESQPVAFGEAVRVVAADYEVELDVYLLRQAQATRRLPPKGAGRVVGGGVELDREHRALTRSRGDNWEECCRAADKLRGRINELLVALDEPERALQFDDRFRRTYAPSIYRDTRVDRLLDRVEAADRGVPTIRHDS
jgi:hypothetical protein